LRVSKDGRKYALCPSFETLAEFIIGPRFARTRWQAPQDEVSFLRRNDAGKLLVVALPIAF
jgi:hypothetical protein